jgi:UDP-N-acetylmuramyl pentapeptide phosphotransferase/UDP-N-acetylglucosamine-1-phosphate transferase
VGLGVSAWVLACLLTLLFVTGAIYALFAQRQRDLQIRTLNSRWFIPMVRAGGVLMMLAAMASALVLAANYGVDFGWPHFKL